MTASVLVGVDGSDSSRRAARRAAEVAAALGAPLVIAVVVDESMGVEVPEGPSLTPGEVAEQIALTVAADVADVTADAETVLLAGKPAEALVDEAARAEAGLIVVGNRRAQGVARVLGSVASGVVSHAPCDVYVVKTV